MEMQCWRPALPKLLHYYIISFTINYTIISKISEWHGQCPLDIRQRLHTRAMKSARRKVGASPKGRIGKGRKGTFFNKIFSDTVSLFVKCGNCDITCYCSRVQVIPYYATTLQDARISYKYATTSEGINTKIQNSFSNSVHDLL